MNTYHWYCSFLFELGENELARDGWKKLHTLRASVLGENHEVTMKTLNQFMLCQSVLASCNAVREPSDNSREHTVSIIQDHELTDYSVEPSEIESYDQFEAYVYSTEYTVNGSHNPDASDHLKVHHRNARRNKCILL